MKLVDQLHETKNKLFNKNTFLIITCFTRKPNTLRDFNPRKIEKQLPERFPFIKAGTDSKIYLNSPFYGNDVGKFVEELFHFLVDFNQLTKVNIFRESYQELDGKYNLQI